MTILKDFVLQEDVVDSVSFSSLIRVFTAMLRKDVDENLTNPSMLKRTFTQEEALESMKKAKIDHDEPTFDDEDEDEECFPAVLSIAQHEGNRHPTSIQYVVYEKAIPAVISKTARSWALKYRRVIDHVDPDVYDMYIHNDFVCYGELEVIENCLLNLEKDLFNPAQKKFSFVRTIHSFRRWEALILLLDYGSSFVGIDDAVRYRSLLRLIGACTVTILRRLLPKSMFNTDENFQFSDDDVTQIKKISQRLVNWREILEQTLVLSNRLLSIGELCSAYINIVQTVYCNWTSIVEKKRLSTSIETDSSLAQALLKAKQIKKTRFRESFDFIKELNNYRVNYPDLGGYSHDLRKWSKARRIMYSFDKNDDESESSFWMRL